MTLHNHQPRPSTARHTTKNWLKLAERLKPGHPHMGILTRAQREPPNMRARTGAGMAVGRFVVMAESRGGHFKGTRKRQRIKHIHPWQCWQLGKHTEFRDLKRSVVVHVEALLFQKKRHFILVVYMSFTNVFFRGPNIQLTRVLFVLWRLRRSNNIFVQWWWRCHVWCRSDSTYCILIFVVQRLPQLVSLL